MATRDDLRGGGYRVGETINQCLILSLDGPTRQLTPDSYSFELIFGLIS